MVGAKDVGANACRCLRTTNGHLTVTAGTSIEPTDQSEGLVVLLTPNTKPLLLSRDTGSHSQRECTSAENDNASVEAVGREAPWPRLGSVRDLTFPLYLYARARSASSALERANDAISSAMAFSTMIRTSMGLFRRSTRRSKRPFRTST